jgi:PPOX class probable F420-dependent enzyme
MTGGIDAGGAGVATGMTTTIPDSHRDLLDQPVATLGTVDPEGRPQLTEVWFLAEDGHVKFSLNTSRQKVRNLQSRPACSVLLLDLANPYRYIEIRGDASLESDDDYAFADRVGTKYGADLRTNDRPGDRRVVVTVQPTRVHTYG